ncbi:hypothetical protein WJX74_001752 [Apatococcus lobatus]|uniref:Uncharacterized protein n=1 Tax=Apatococcus lobatus TaxID=904363 RepID=A0AAW1R2C7_9CHLO
MQQTLTELQEPLQLFLLPHLTALSLANLRASCQAGLVLVDKAPMSLLKQSFSQLLPPQLIETAESASDIRLQLCQQASVLSAIKSRTPKVQHLDLQPYIMVQALHWKPTCQSTHVVLHLVHESYEGCEYPDGLVQDSWACRNEEAIGLAVIGLQNTGDGSVISPQHMYQLGSFIQLAFCSKIPFVVCRWPEKVGVLDALTGFLATPAQDVEWGGTDHLNVALDLSWLRPDGLLLASKQGDRGSSIAVLSIPTLEQKYQIHAPDCLQVDNEDTEAQIGWLGWSASGKYLAIAWRKRKTFDWTDEEDSDCNDGDATKGWEFLTIHAGQDGTLIGCFDMARHMNRSGRWEMEYFTIANQFCYTNTNSSKYCSRAQQQYGIWHFKVDVASEHLTGPGIWHGSSQYVRIHKLQNLGTLIQQIPS